MLPRANGASRVGDQARVSPGPPQPHNQRYPGLVANNALPGFGTPPGQGNQAQKRPLTLQEIEAEMIFNAQMLRERQEREREELLQQELEQQRLARQQQQYLLRQQQEQLLLQQQERLREQELRQRMIYQQEHLQRQRLLQQQQRELQQHTPPPRMIPTSKSPRFLEQQRQLLLLQQYEEQQRRLQLEEQLRREELERQMLSMSLERGRVDSPLYNGRRPQGNNQSEIQEAQLLQQAYERQLQHQTRRQSSRSPAVSNPQYASALQQQQERHLAQDNLMQQRLLAELVAHGDLPADLPGISKADQETLRAEAMRKIVAAERMEERRRRKAAKIAHMVCYPFESLKFGIQVFIKHRHAIMI